MTAGAAVALAVALPLAPGVAAADDDLQPDEVQHNVTYRARVDGLAVLSSPTAGGACLDHRGGVLVIDGCSLEVLEPAEVREQVRGILKAAVGLY